MKVCLYLCLLNIRGDYASGVDGEVSGLPDTCASGGDFLCALNYRGHVSQHSNQANCPAQHVIGCINIANRGADIAVSHGAHQHPNAHSSGGQSCGKTATATVAGCAVYARTPV